MQDCDVAWMEIALAVAHECAANGEVPVGAVVVIDDALIARGGNRTRTDTDPTAHAEIVALRAAAKAVGNHRLSGATLYVTLEPCAMCAGAIVQARVARLVYGARDPKAGAVDSYFGICTTEFLNHRVAVTHGVLAEECGDALRRFFRKRRKARFLEE
jgi:tRNA(adenine34) deaminase